MGNYAPLQLGVPGQPKTPNLYNAESTLLCPVSSRLFLQISVAAVFVQRGIMPQGIGSGIGSIVWQEEEPYLPMVASLGRRFDAVRVRNFTSGVEAQAFVLVN